MTAGKKAVNAIAPKGVKSSLFMTIRSGRLLRANYGPDGEPPHWTPKQSKGHALGIRMLHAQL
jgi:hypothetical protein